MIGTVIYDKQKKSMMWRDRISLFLLIIVSSQTVLFGTNSISVYSTIGNLAILLFGFSFFIRANREGKSLQNSKASRPTYILIISLIFSSLINLEVSVEYIMRVGIILAAFYFVCSIPFERFKNAYEDSILFIVICSIGFYVLSIVAPSIMSYFGILNNSSNIPFYNCLICVIPATEEFRLYGPFREPGVFQILLNIALLLHLSYTEKVRFWKVVFYFAGVILTYSTTGYICLILLILHFVISRGSKSTRGKGSVILLLVIFVAFYLLYTKTSVFSIEGVVFGKLFDTGNASSISRYGSVVANLKFFMEDPLFGVGFERVSELFPLYVKRALGEESRDNANSILMNFATTGFFYGVTYLVGFWKFSKNLSSNKVSSIILFLIICLLLSGENINRFIITYIFLFYGFMSHAFQMSKGPSNYKR